MEHTENTPSLSRVDDRQSTLPNLVIAGVGKSGTTSLFWYLGRHPAVCPSHVKEINYFSAARSGSGLRPLQTYADFFSHWAGEPYRLEASPSYFYGGSPVVTALRQTLERPRIIISLREPVSRFWSSYTFLKSMGELPKDITFERYFRQCKQLLPTGGVGDSPPEHTTPLSVGFYHAYLQPWFDAFGHDALRIVFAEDLFSAPQPVIEDLCSWLGIGVAEAAAIDYRVHNDTVQPRSHKLAKWAYRGRSASNRVFRRYPAARAALRQGYAALNRRREKEVLDPRMRERVEAVYRVPNKKTAERLRDRGYEDLPVWLATS